MALQTTKSTQSIPDDPSKLAIVTYPHPALRKVSVPVTVFDGKLQALVNRMYELMRQEKGVGLAAPQVGTNIRLFIINPTGKPADDRTYVNPTLTEPSEEQEAEEGCLSLPDIQVKVVRAKNLHIRAQDLNGEWFEEAADGYVPRIWQHENDHLDGILLLDKMGPLDKLAARKTLRKLEDEYEVAHPAPPRRRPARR